MTRIRVLNVLLLVVDSLRAQALRRRESAITTPFLRRLDETTISFRRAYATECWTLPTHVSMFTGRLPCEHGAHFQTMGYTQPELTLAEHLSRAGFHTEVVTRNSIFDGALPGITRGFRANTRLLSERGGLDPLAFMLAASKPRFRRQIQTSGFFHPAQRQNRKFVSTFARATLPADRRVLEYALERMAQWRREGTAHFLFCNLYDVHAPYPPTETSIWRPFRSWAHIHENLRMPFVLPCLGGHTYLRPGFRLSATSRQMLLDRYYRAIELMDAKLADFWRTAEQSGLLNDTLVIVTSDHGEAFGEHNLYLHDASVYETHLHVPLWIHHPDRSPTTIDDVVSTKDLFRLVRSVALGEGTQETILDTAYRAKHPIALAEHFYYPHCQQMHPRYRQNFAAAVSSNAKVILRREGVECYDPTSDPDEKAPTAESLGWFEERSRQAGCSAAAIQQVMSHLRTWQTRSRATPTQAAA